MMLKRSSLYTLSAIVGIICLSMIVIPYFFHDFKLTLDRSSYIAEEMNRNVSTTIFNEKIIKELGLESVFGEVDVAYESTKACSEPNDYYSNGCRIEQNIKAYHAYDIIEELDFTSYPRSPGHYAVAIEGHDKLYFVYLDSINWIQYMLLGSIISIAGLLFSVWLFLRREKHISRMQNHGVGITLGILSVSLVIFSLVMAQTELLMAVFIPSPYAMLFIGVPFMATYAIWYHMVGNNFVKDEAFEKPETK